MRAKSNLGRKLPVLLSFLFGAYIPSLSFRILSVLILTPVQSSSFLYNLTFYFLK